MTLKPISKDLEVSGRDSAPEQELAGYSFKNKFSNINAATVPKRKESFPAKAMAMPATQTKGTNQRGRVKCSWIWMWDEKWPQGLPGMHAPGLEGVQGGRTAVT